MKIKNTAGQVVHFSSTNELNGKTERTEEDLLPPFE